MEVSTAERIRADECHLIRHSHVSQRSAAVKGIVANGHDTVRNNCGGQPRAPGKGVLADTLHRAVGGNYGVVGAGDQRTIQQADQAAVGSRPDVVGLIHFDGSQRVAVGKRALPDGGQVRGDAELLQRRTATENVGTQPDDLISQCHLGQGGHVRKGVIANRVHGICNHNLRDSLADALPRRACRGAVIVRGTFAADCQHAGVRIKAPGCVFAAGAALLRCGTEHAAGIQ